MKPPVLVTGAAGLVGSHLCDRLIEGGHPVLALDDLSTGHRKHLQHLTGDRRFTLLIHDITQPLPAEASEAHAIYNLACPASPIHYRKEPLQTMLASVLGMWRVLELAARTGARVLQGSTAEVYGDPQEHPQTEAYFGNVNPIGPRACHDEGKRCAETLSRAYRSERNVDVRIARLFNCYGPRTRVGDGRVVGNFIVQALRGEPLTIYGDGRQTRSFCYVTDTVDGLVRLMDSQVEGPVNIGNPEECSVLELAQAVLALTGSGSTLVRRPLPTDDAARRQPDIGLAQRQLGWEPTVGLQEGLRLTIDYFRNELGTVRPPQRARASAAGATQD
jgi:UDP-glucuronate decarboxylase